MMDCGCVQRSLLSVGLMPSLSVAHLEGVVWLLCLWMPRLLH